MLCVCNDTINKQTLVQLIVNKRCTPMYTYMIRKRFNEDSMSYFVAYCMYLCDKSSLQGKTILANLMHTCRVVARMTHVTEPNAYFIKSEKSYFHKRLI